jgi:hypothetical protein
MKIRLIFSAMALVVDASLVAASPASGIHRAPPQPSRTTCEHLTGRLGTTRRGPQRQTFTPIYLYNSSGKSCANPALTTRNEWSREASFTDSFHRSTLQVDRVSADHPLSSSRMSRTRSTTRQVRLGPLGTIRMGRPGQSMPCAQ